VRIGSRVTLRSGSQTWTVLRADGRPQQGASTIDRPFGLSAIDRWCNDEILWPEVLRVYEAVSGETLRSPTTFDMEQHVKPCLLRAFERGHIVLADPTVTTRARDKDAGVHMRMTPPEPVPPPPRPAKRPVVAAPVSSGPTIPPFSVDQDLQAATLVGAAEAGVPFCEECEKARQEQAAGADA
jgi:hypothetical protein